MCLHFISIFAFAERGPSRVRGHLGRTGGTLERAGAVKRFNKKKPVKDVRMQVHPVILMRGVNRDVSSLFVSFLLAER